MKTCAHCSNDFQPTQTTQRFCSKSCRNGFHNSRQIWSERPDREQHNARKKARYQDDPEAAAAKMKQWRAEHPEDAREQSKRSKLKHRPAVLERLRAWHGKNKDRQNAKRRGWHHANKEQANESRRTYHADHRDAANTKQRGRFQMARLNAPWSGLMMSARARAKKKGLPFNLTEEWAKERWTGCCEVSKLPFRLGLRGNGPKTFSPSIDQIIAKKGYTIDNCRIVIWAVNALKHDGTDEEMYLVAEAIMKNKIPV